VKNTFSWMKNSRTALLVAGLMLLFVYACSGDEDDANEDSTDGESTDLNTGDLSGDATRITGTIYADNYFELYVNGERVAVDPLDFTPHQAVQVSFDVPQGTLAVYAIVASDFATESGYEYTESSSPQLGDGGLIAVFSDGQSTGADWKCYTALYGPTEASEAAGCNANNLDACAVSESAIPDGWADVDFDDSGWEQATEHSAQAVGWGRNPDYRNGECCTITSPLTREDASPSCLAMDESQCLSPEEQSWGDAEFIWGSDLERVNKILCRSQL
jgi:hypothetical protein